MVSAELKLLLGNIKSFSKGSLPRNGIAPLQENVFEKTFSWKSFWDMFRHLVFPLNCLCCMHLKKGQAAIMAIARLKEEA